MSINSVLDGLRDRRLAVIQDEMSDVKNGGCRGGQRRVCISRGTLNDDRSRIRAS